MMSSKCCAALASIVFSDMTVRLLAVRMVVDLRKSAETIISGIASEYALLDRKSSVTAALFQKVDLVRCKDFMSLSF